MKLYPDIFTGFAKTTIAQLCIVLTVTASLFLPVSPVRAPVYANEYDQITKELQETKQQLEMLQRANDTNKGRLEEVNSQLDNLRGKVDLIESEIAIKEEDVKRGEARLRDQKELLDQRIKVYYKNMSRNTRTVVDLLAAENLADSFRTFMYQKTFLEDDKRNIVTIVSYISRIEKAKEELTTEKNKLQPIKAELNQQSEFLASEVEKADEYEDELEQKITALTEKQKSILAARSGGGTTTSVGNVPASGDPASTIAYKASAPANSIAVFSFGAYTHRNGMSQYGAQARAESGRNYQEILKAYYPSANLENRGDLPGSINVDGYGSISLEDKYLYGIAEMPSNWHPEALKAQAIAARTYAVRRVGWPDNTNGSMCTTEACQVYLDSKANNPPDAWREAVNATRGQVLIKDGKPEITQYSSTSGGYLNTSGWDTTDGSGNGDWTSRAYESLANSPWFYRSWYRRGYSDGADSCGRAHPWLSQEEFSDIINAWIVRKNPNGADVNRIVPVTINECSIGDGGGEPYSMSELRDLAGKAGGAVTSVTGVTVSNNGNGQTTNVRLETNRGVLNIPGSEFKDTFNVRAPGYIRIPQFGFSFFNIEKK